VQFAQKSSQGGEIESKAVIKLAYKTAFLSISPSGGRPMLLVRLGRTRRCTLRTIAAPASRVRPFAALTVRKRGNAGQIPSPQAIFNEFFHMTAKELNDCLNTSVPQACTLAANNTPMPKI